MTDAQTLRELIERCEKVTGPDRELDALITIALDYAPIPLVEQYDASHTYFEHIGRGRIIRRVRGGTSQRLWQAITHNLTASTDSALAFRKELVPNCQCKLYLTPQGAGATLLTYGQDGPPILLGRYDRNDPDILALAIVTATLRSKLAEMEASSE